MLGKICFIFVWIFFAMVMIRGPLAETLFGSAQADSDDFFAGTGIWIVLAVASGIGSAFFFVTSYVVGGIKTRRIIANGLDAEAEVLRLSETGVRINHSPVIDVTLEVRPTNMPSFVTNQRMNIPLTHLPNIQPGRILNVKYMPGSEQIAIVGAKLD